MDSEENKNSACVFSTHVVRRLHRYISLLNTTFNFLEMHLWSSEFIYFWHEERLPYYHILISYFLLQPKGPSTLLGEWGLHVPKFQAPTTIGIYPSFSMLPKRLWQQRQFLLPVQ